MAKYGSGDQQNLKVGISSFSEDKTSLQVIGKVGVGTDDSMQSLHVEGSAYVSGGIGIGTTVPASAVASDNTAILNVGIVTAREIYGELKEGTGIVTTAYNVAGGADGKLLIQSDVGVTSFFEYGSTGQVLTSSGDGNPPTWVNSAPSGAIEGILLFEEGSAVGLGTTYSGLDFRGSNITIDGTEAGFIATLTSTGNFGSEFITGAGITVTGVGTFSGGIQAAGIVSAIPGMALTYFGDGSNLEGVVAGYWEKTDVGINTLSNVGIGTTNPLNDLQVGLGNSSFTVVSTATTTMVGIGTTNPEFTLDVKGNTNIDGDLTVNGENVSNTSLGMIIALGGF